MSDAEEETIAKGILIEGPRRTSQKVPGLQYHTMEIVGTWDEALSLYEELKVGFRFKNSTKFPDLNNCYIADTRLQRREGNRTTLVVTYLNAEAAAIINIKMMAIQKDIRTWEGSKTSTSSGSDTSGSDNSGSGSSGSGDGPSGPDLSIIRGWEQLRGTQWNTDYYNYSYQDPSTKEIKAIPAGDTLELAKMILDKGITSYTVHTPVVTRTFTSIMNSSFGEGLDCWCTAEKLISELKNSKIPSIGQDDWSVLSKLAKKYIYYDCSYTTNQNGSHTITQTWLGATDIEEKLYKEYSPSYDIDNGEEDTEDSGSDSGTEE